MIGGRKRSASAERIPQADNVAAEEFPLIGQSPVFRQLLELTDAVAENDCIVLLEGESGTGKELIARRIHARSRRNAGPFVPVNCPAISETIFESQFYGHVKGSFTGAAGDTLGIVRAAEAGTLFLDEIGELTLQLQPKLLRLLQESEVTPVGATSPVRVDVRFVAATNRSLARAVSAGRFRRDLYHRLNVVRIEVPPLRHRPQDIQLLLDHYLQHFASEYQADVKTISPELWKSLVTYDWPGNVRELCCWVERLYAANIPPRPPGQDAWDDLYPGVGGDAQGQYQAEPQTNPTPEAPVQIERKTPIQSLADAEAIAIRSALTKTNNNRSAAARMLNIHRTTLLRKIRQYNLE